LRRLLATGEAHVENRNLQLRTHEIFIHLETIEVPPEERLPCCTVPFVPQQLGKSLQQHVGGWQESRNRLNQLQPLQNIRERVQDPLPLQLLPALGELLPQLPNEELG
jgi:hypothetical protein